MTDEQKTKLEKIKELVRNKQHEELVETLNELRKDIKAANFVRNLEFEKIVIDKVLAEIPERQKIDWENMPEQKEVDLTPLVEKQNETIDAIKGIKLEQKATDLSPLAKAFKQVETIISTLGKTIIGTLNRIVFLISEPDEQIIEYNKRIDIYGDRTVTYILTRDSKGKIVRTKRAES